MDNAKVPGFGKSDKQIADAFGMSVSDYKKVKRQIMSDMTKPKKPAATPKKAVAKPTAKPTAKPKKYKDAASTPGFLFGKGTM